MLKAFRNLSIFNNDLIAALFLGRTTANHEGVGTLTREFVIFPLTLPLANRQHICIGALSKLIMVGITMAQIRVDIYAIEF